MAYDNRSRVITPAEVISSSRMSTYLAKTSGDLTRALDLYGWNAAVSAALMLPAHFSEVSTRNAVDEALRDLYGDEWPKSTGFRESLPNPGGRSFNPRRHLIQVSDHHPTTGKVIADLKFAFWENMFTARHYDRLWKTRIQSVFPNAQGTPSAVRAQIADDLKKIRQLRNRIAHHEPVFTRDLAADHARILNLVALRSDQTRAWLHTMDQTRDILARRP